MARLGTLNKTLEIHVVINKETKKVGGGRVDNKKKLPNYSTFIMGQALCQELCLYYFSFFIVLEYT